MATLKAVFNLIMAFFMTLPQFLAPIPDAINQAKYFEDWSVEQAYTADYAIELQKDPNEDFVVLNLTDIQLEDLETYNEVGAGAKAMIAKLVEEQQPDLITLSGDNAWASMAYIEMVNYIDSFNIPWAPVMGNHDGQGCISEFWCARLFDKAENCLWKFGPKDMGYGNYIINITENGEVVHTLFMMDTHSDAIWEDENGKEAEGYDHLWENQIEWYKWAVNGIAAQAGKTVESTVIMHIPVVQYTTAWNMVSGEFNYDDETVGRAPEAYNVEITSADGHTAVAKWGKRGEPCCPPPVDNGFFDVAKDLGSTKTMIVGHDHVNDFAVVYDGITLAYGVKLGEGCYFEAGMMGGTTLTIGSDGAGTLENHYLA